MTTCGGRSQGRCSRCHGTSDRKREMRHRETQCIAPHFCATLGTHPLHAPKANVREPRHGCLFTGSHGPDWRLFASFGSYWFLWRIPDSACMLVFLQLCRYVLLSLSFPMDFHPLVRICCWTFSRRLLVSLIHARRQWAGSSSHPTRY